MTKYRIYYRTYLTGRIAIMPSRFQPTKDEARAFVERFHGHAGATVIRTIEEIKE